MRSTSDSDNPAATPERRLRADASRNVELLITAARELFEQSGAEVPLDEVARQAGVGNATLYRHFPTRGDLLVAVYADEVAKLRQRGVDLLIDPSPLDALFSWLDDFVVHIATKRVLALAATDGPSGRRSRLFDQWHESMRLTATALLDRARNAGAVRSDITATDLLALAGGVAMTGKDRVQTRRLLRLLRSGVVPDQDGDAD